MMKRIAIALLLALPLAPPAAAQAAPPPSIPAQASQLDFLQELTRKTERRIANANQTPELRGSGPNPARMELDLALPNATIYRPADLTTLGSRKLGVLIWGNGGCSNDGASARAHLAEIASHGYLVVAPGKPLTGPLTLPGGPNPVLMTTSIQDMRAALDWALAENRRAGSPYYRRLDPAMVAASGHSCGGMLAIMLGEDPRIRAVIIHNSGIFAVLPDNPPFQMHRERLQGRHTPVLFVMGGKGEVAWTPGEVAFDGIEKVPVFLGSIDVGHGGTFNQPHGGEAAQVAKDWLEWQLRGDKLAAEAFVGANCKLCVDPRWTVRKKRIP